MAEHENPEWRRMADTAPYTIGARIRPGRPTAWYTYDIRDENGEPIGRMVKSRETAIARADALNARFRAGR